MPRLSILIISLFFFTGSLTHYLLTDFFINAMPAYFGFHREIVITSGVFEFLGATGLLIPKCRKIAGYSLIALCIAVFPVNINMALHPLQFSSIPEIILYCRLPLQALLIWFIWWAIKLE